MLVSRFIAMLACCILASGCAWTSESVAVFRQPVPVAAVPGANMVTVTVTAADARQEREVSHKKNGYGMRAADITAANDIVAEVRDGVSDILRAQGFGTGSEANVRLELSRFYNTFDMGFWSATANAQITATLQVLASDGRNLYSRVYNANYQLTGVQLMTADNAASALRSALLVLLRQIADDPQLPLAILQAKPTTPESTSLPRGGRARPTS
jgi:uncharacterized lipoprotein YajG